MSPAQKFLQRVEQTGMVSEPLLAELRRRVSETHRNMRPEMLAKLLVDRGELTAAQARKLVTLTTEEEKASGGASPPPPPEEPELTLAKEEESFDFLSEDSPESLDVANDPAPGELGLADEEEAELDLVVDEDPPEAILVDEGDDLLADVPEPTVKPPPGPRERMGEGDAILGEVDVVEPTSGEILDEVLGDAELRQAGQSTRLSRRSRGFSGFLGDLFGSRRPRKNRWDSPLILLGGGGLILLVAAGFAFFALFYSENAEEIYTVANDAYTSQSYSSAIENFTRLDARYPGHEKASLARVRIELAKIRQVTDGTKDWEAALARVRDGLPRVKGEEAFDDVRPELAKLLPDITTGLVEMAAAATTADEKERLLDLASTSLGLVDDPEYLPTSVKAGQEGRIEDIKLNMSVVRRGIERDRKLAAALTGIRSAAEEGDFSAAYRTRDELLSLFPILADNSALLDVLQVVASKEKDGVAVGGSERQPSTEEHPRAVDLTVVLSDQRGDSIQRDPSEIVCVVVNAAVYGVRVATGDVLWRRYVGFNTDVFPQPVSTGAGEDVILVDAAHGEVQRLRVATGDLVWRLPCPAPIYQPLLDGDRLLICCGREDESRLLSLDLKTGTPGSEVRFPVGCVQPPAYLPATNQFLQVGTHSSVYVLDGSNLKAENVISLGHYRASVATKPVVVGGCLVIAVNHGSNASRLHVFAAAEDGTWVATQEAIELGSQLISDMVTDDRRLVVTTDQGAVLVLEAPVDQAGLRQVASLPGGGAYVGPTFALLDRSNLWIANQTFGRYELQATRGTIVTKWVRNREDRFLHPLLRLGAHLLHVRTRKGMMGATVAATEVTRQEGDGAPVWESDIGVPSDITVSSSGAVHATTVNGAVFPINREAVRRGISSITSARVDPRLLPGSTHATHIGSARSNSAGKSFTN